ncbi:MAG: hypothetical protein ACRDA5_01470 [Clostridium sp.]
MSNTIQKITRRKISELQGLQMGLIENSIKDIPIKYLKIKRIKPKKITKSKVKVILCYRNNRKI